MDWLLGLTGFLLFFLYDWNRIFRKLRWMNGFFYGGCLCLVLAGAFFVSQALRTWSGPALLWLLLSILFLMGLLYTLFFALPFDATYLKEADQHRVCRAGHYGLCRHPGIWWFLGCYLCLGMAAGGLEKLLEALVFSLLNLGYAWYQDRYIFPEEFCDYEDYQRKVPFLLPRMQKHI